MMNIDKIREMRKGFVGFEDNPEHEFAINVLDALLDSPAQLGAALGQAGGETWRERKEELTREPWRADKGDVAKLLDDLKNAEVEVVRSRKYLATPTLWEWKFSNSMHSYYSTEQLTADEIVLDSYVRSLPNTPKEE